MEFETKFLARRRQIAAFLALESTLASSAESLVLIDRYLYLGPFLTVYRACLGRG